MQITKLFRPPYIMLVVSTTFLQVCFLSLSKSTCQARKNVFNWLQKLFLFWRRSNLRILHFQIYLCHQMHKYKTRNTFHWINWEGNSLLMKFAQCMLHYKRKSFTEKSYKKCGLEPSSRSFSVCKELSTTSTGKWNFWSELLILDMK